MTEDYKAARIAELNVIIAAIRSAKNSSLLGSAYNRATYRQYKNILDCVSKLLTEKAYSLELDKARQEAENK